MTRLKHAKPIRTPVDATGPFLQAMNGLPKHHQTDIMSGDGDLNMDECLLDWRENEQRSAGDLWRTDLAFVGMSLFLTGLLMAAVAIGVYWLRT